MLPQEEPVITEIHDDDEEITNIKSIDINETENADKSDVIQNNDNSNNNVNEIDDTLNESDVQILEPKISVMDLDEIEDDDNDNSTKSSTKENVTDETSQSNLVKIKEEPRDDGYNEDDAFEDVGTFEIIEDGKFFFFA